jgi:hypothetical protein
MSYPLTPDELEILLNAPPGMDVAFCKDDWHTLQRGGYRLMGPSTSKAAAMGVNVPQREAQVIAALEQMPDREGTVEQITDYLTQMNDHDEVPSNISPRIAPLRRKGYIKDTGRTRKSRQGKAQKVWGLV